MKMKKLIPLQQKKIKQSAINKQLNERSFLKLANHEKGQQKRQRKLSSVQKQQKQMSKNDLRVSIYTDKQGFILDYSILNFGVKCQCSISQNAGKKFSKSSTNTSLLNLSNQSKIKKNTKLQITLNKCLIAIIKNGVQHIFDLPEQRKHNFLKIVLVQNWELSQFTILNKKVKIQNGQFLSADQKTYDQIYPLNKIQQAEQLRKSKLTKSDSKIKIAWNNDTFYKDNTKQFQNTNSYNSIQNNLSFVHKTKDNFEQNLHFMSRSLIVRPNSDDQIPGNAFMRKSLINDQDQTRDSEQEQFSFISQNEKEKKNNFLLTPVKKQNKTLKSININLNQWHRNQQMQSFKHQIQQIKKQSFLIYTPRQKQKSNNYQFFSAIRHRK